MIAVFDASAAVKLELDEPGSSQVEEVWRDRAVLVVAPAVVVPEVASAIAAARRAGRLDPHQEAILQQRWFERTQATLVVAVDPELANHAAALARDRVIGGCDSLYVAVAREIALTGDRPVGLVSFDARQRAAVRPGDGVALIPASDHGDGL